MKNKESRNINELVDKLEYRRIGITIWTTIVCVLYICGVFFTEFVVCTPTSCGLSWYPYFLIGISVLYVLTAYWNIRYYKNDYDNKDFRTLKIKAAIKTRGMLVFYGAIVLLFIAPAIINIKSYVSINDLCDNQELLKQYNPTLYEELVKTFNNSFSYTNIMSMVDRNTLRSPLISLNSDLENSMDSIDLSTIINPNIKDYIIELKDSYFVPASFDGLVIILLCFVMVFAEFVPWIILKLNPYKVSKNYHPISYFKCFAIGRGNPDYDD